MSEKPVEEIEKLLENFTIEDIRLHLKKINKIDDDKTRDKILIYLNEEGAIDERSAVRPLKIAKHIFGDNATKKQVGTHLYTLLKEKKVAKVSEEEQKRPRWYIV